MGTGAHVPGFSTNVTAGVGDGGAGAVTQSVYGTDHTATTTVTIGVGEGASITPDATVTATSPTVGELVDDAESKVKSALQPLIDIIDRGHP